MENWKITLKFKILIILLLFCNIIVFTTLAQTYYSPESAVFDPVHNRYIVSNAGTGMSGGNLVAVDRNSLAISNYVTSGLNSPKGLCIVGDSLYTSNITNLKVMELSTGQITNTINISGSQFLNDIATDNTYLYVSDNAAHKIFKVEIATGQLVATYSDASISFPNGLYFDAGSNRLIFCSFTTDSPIQAIDIATGNVSLLLPTPLVNLDGITRDNAGDYYVSSWGTNKVYKIDNTLSTIIDSIDYGFSGPADIYYNIINDTLVVPNWNSSHVNFIYLPSASIYEMSFFNYDLKIYPNPVDNLLTISYELDDLTKVRIEILDLNGKKIRELFNKIYTPSYYKHVFDIKSLNLHSGVYYINCYFNDGKVLKKIVIPR